MFHIFDDQNSQHVFTNDDPRDDGFTGPVETDVFLEIPGDLKQWPTGTRRPEPVLAISPTNQKDYKVFKHDDNAKSAGFRIVGGLPSTASSYAAYIRSIYQACTVGSHRLALHNAWDQVGPMIRKNRGDNDPTPNVVRRLIRSYLDGEPSTNLMARTLKDHEKSFIF